MPPALPGSYRNKNMIYGIHPNAISLPKELELELCRWVMRRTHQGRPVSRLGVRKRARKLLGSKYFQATEGWLRKFISRHPEMKDYLLKKSTPSADY